MGGSAIQRYIPHNGGSSATTVDIVAATALLDIVAATALLDIVAATALLDIVAADGGRWRQMAAMSEYTALLIWL